MERSAPCGFLVNFMNQTVKESKSATLIRIFDIAVSVLAAIVGLAFILAAAHLYYTGGDNPYTRERVGEYLIYLLAPSIAFIAVTVVSLILHAVHGTQEKLTAYADPSYVLMRTEGRTPVYKLARDVREVIAAEQKKRFIYKCSAAVITLASLVVAAVLALDKTQYKNEQLTEEVVGAVSFVLPLALVMIAALTLCSYLCTRSSSRELAIHREAVQNKSFDEQPIEKDSIIESVKRFVSSNSNAIGLVCRIAVGAAAVALLVFGMLGGGMADVLAKAVKICTECIGLG